MQAPGSFSLSRQDAEQELLRGSLIQNGSLRIYALYQHNPTVKEAVDFLKEEYGIGGHSYTFWDGGNGFVDYDSKGIHFRRYADQATALLPWKEADKLLRHLIHSERYLSEKDARKYAQLEEDFSGWPGGVPMPYPGAVFPDPVLDLDASLIREALAQHDITDTPPPRNLRITDDHLGEGGCLWTNHRRTKMRNVAGLSAAESQRSSDMFSKRRYMDELTENRGVIFAFGTPVSNFMTELYTVMRYLQYSTLRRLGITHFDCWASTFGETTTAIELAPDSAVFTTLGAAKLSRPLYDPQIPAVRAGGAKSLPLLGHGNFGRIKIKLRDAKETLRGDPHESKFL